MFGFVQYLLLIALNHWNVWAIRNQTALKLKIFPIGRSEVRELGAAGVWDCTLAREAPGPEVTMHPGDTFEDLYFVTHNPLSFVADPTEKIPKENRGPPHTSDRCGSIESFFMGKNVALVGT